jgi:hypothetical protein
MKKTMKPLAIAPAAAIKLMARATREAAVAATAATSGGMLSGSKP